MFDQCKKVKLLMSGYGRTWAIAGGWAVDLFLEKKTREHSDIEIAVYRVDQVELRMHLSSFVIRKVVHGKLVDWEGETLMLPVHELHAQRDEQQIEILLNEVEDGKWIFRRDPQIQFTAEQVIRYSPDAIPYLHPAIVLLYKAKHMRDKDHQDFLLVKDRLSEQDKKWLLHSLEIHQPDHPWIGLLGGVRP